MATWFDLPPEVKQIIFSMVSDADSIIYVPRDYRRKVDVRYIQAHHFHDLLLVSKTFITPDEFAFAVLNSAKLTFYSYNELRRLIAEVPSSFKESIRYIHFSRTHIQDTTYTDTFSGFGAIEKTLSTHMPQLRRIYISWPDYCAQAALCQMPRAPLLSAQDPMCFNVVEEILSEKVQEEISAEEILHRNSLSHIAASFVGNRGTKHPPYNWTRPLGWIRKLMSYAENQNIEVVLQMNICIAYVYQFPYLAIQEEDDKTMTSCCWSASGPYASQLALWQTHLEGEMSSTDYILRVEHDGQKFAYYQKLAYDLLHSSGREGIGHWLNMVEDVNPRSPFANYFLSRGDGF